MGDAIIFMAAVAIIVNFVLMYSQARKHKRRMDELEQQTEYEDQLFV